MNQDSEMRQAEFLAAGETSKAILWPTQGLKEKTFDSSGFSAEGTSICALVVRQRWRPERHQQMSVHAGSQTHALNGRAETTVAECFQRHALSDCSSITR